MYDAVHRRTYKDWGYVVKHLHSFHRFAVIQMSIKILCLSRSYQSYAARYNPLTKYQSPATSLTQDCRLLLLQSHNNGIQNAILFHPYSSNSSSISATRNEHLSGIQRDRQRAAEMLSAASGDSSPTPSTPSSLVKNGQSLVQNKLNSLYQHYDRFSHTNEIREAHEHVERLQEELKATQQKRRDVAKQMNDVRYELQVCYGELASCQKGEPRYLELVRKEYEVSANTAKRFHLKVTRKCTHEIDIFRFITERNNWPKNLIYWIKPNVIFSFIYKPLWKLRMRKRKFIRIRPSIGRSLDRY